MDRSGSAPRIDGMRGAVLVMLAALVAACGSGSAGAPADAPSPAPSRGYDNAERGFSARIPPGWHQAQRRVTPLTDPVETLVAATYEPQRGAPCGPLAFAGFDAHEALVLVLERGLDAEADWSDFPPRPARFAYEPGMDTDFTSCLEADGVDFRDHWFRFSDSGRHFHVLVVIGDRAPARVEAEAYGLLDSLRFDPAVRPDWPSAG